MALGAVLVLLFQDSGF